MAEWKLPFHQDERHVFGRRGRSRSPVAEPPWLRNRMYHDDRYSSRVDERWWREDPTPLVDSRDWNSGRPRYYYQSGYSDSPRRTTRHDTYGSMSYDRSIDDRDMYGYSQDERSRWDRSFQREEDDRSRWGLFHRGSNWDEDNRSRWVSFHRDNSNWDEDDDYFRPPSPSQPRRLKRWRSDSPRNRSTATNKRSVAKTTPVRTVELTTADNDSSTTKTVTQGGSADNNSQTTEVHSNTKANITTNFHCKVCDIYTTDDQNLQNHLQGMKHLRRIGKKQATIVSVDYTTDDVTDSEESVKAKVCNICGQHFKAEEVNEEKHLATERHQRWMYTFKKKHKQKTEIETVFSDVYMANDDLMEVLQLEENPNGYCCSVCDVTLLTLTIYKQHKNGQKHQKLVQKKEKSVDNDVKHHCDVCGVDIQGDVSLKAHLQGQKHRKNTDRNNQEKEVKNVKVRCDVCDVVCASEGNYAQHVAGKQHKKKSKKEQITTMKLEIQKDEMNNDSNGQ